MASGLVESPNQTNEILVSSAPDAEKDMISEVVESSPWGSGIDPNQ